MAKNTKRDHSEILTLRWHQIATPEMGDAMREAFADKYRRPTPPIKL